MSNVIILFCFVALFYHHSANERYLSYLYIAFSTKCALNGLACLQSSPVKKSTAKLWCFVENLEKFLEDIELPEYGVKEKRFFKKIRVWLYLFTMFTLLNTFALCFVTFGFREVPELNKELHNMTIIISRPFPPAVAIGVTDIILVLFCFAAWFLPAALCGILSQCLTYCFDEMYRYFEKRKSECPLKSNTLCIQKCIRETRLKYLQLSKLVQGLDGMMKYLYLFSYLLDIINICLTMHLVVINYHNWLPRVIIIIWFIPPLFTLFALSYYSSQIIEKVSFCYVPS